MNDGLREGQIFYFLKHWSRSNKLGQAFSPSAAFDLPDGSTCKADGACISTKKLARLSSEEMDSIALIVPDFVIETRSKTDSLAQLKRKMTDVWIATAYNSPGCSTRAAKKPGFIGPTARRKQSPILKTACRARPFCPVLSLI